MSVLSCAGFLVKHEELKKWGARVAGRELSIASAFFMLAQLVQKELSKPQYQSITPKAFPPGLFPSREDGFIVTQNIVVPRRYKGRVYGFEREAERELGSWLTSQNVSFEFMDCKKLDVLRN